jgi:hypothetical protein
LAQIVICTAPAMVNKAAVNVCVIIENPNHEPIS